MAIERRFIMNDENSKSTAKIIEKLTMLQVITDSETGVQYLFASFSQAGGLTVLLDKNGNPLLNEQYVKNTN